MADEFKPYDKISILSRLNISKMAYGRRELILLTVCGCLVVLVLIFAGLYGNAKLFGEGRASASALMAKHYCTTKGCLETAARVQELLDRSVDPCHNFYQFACGGYKPVKRVLNFPSPRSVRDDMETQNQERIISVLEQPVKQNNEYDTERKLKQFYQACNDMFNREKLRGTPFLTKVLPALGGWKLLGTWDNNNWDFNTALKKVHGDFSVDAIYSPYVLADPYNRDATVIQLAPGGVSRLMWWGWYIYNYYEYIRTDYKKFIRRVGSLLIRDSVDTPLKNESLQAEYLEEFVNDTFNFERNLARIATQTSYTNNPFDEMNKVNLTDLGTETGGVIDWLSQLAYILNQAEITGSTKVVVHRREYLKDVTDMITSLPAADRNRILHNYLIWRVLEPYVQDMSSEYIHANKEVYSDIHWHYDFTSQYLTCLRRAQFYMKDALGSLFINEHFSEDNRDWVTNITTNIKLALQQQLEKTPWLDADTKTYAREKLDKVTFKMGYPDWMGNMDTVNKMYTKLLVNVSDHFGNLLSANKFKRAEWSERLNSPSDNREEWKYPVYSTHIWIYREWNEVVAPAGILQSPIFHRDQPHFSTFGSLGSLLGRFLHHVVDEWGKSYDKTGNHMDSGTWWSNSSMEAYKKIRACVVSVYKNVTKTFELPWYGWKIIVPINAEYYTPTAIAWTNGVRLSQLGYADWLKSKGIGDKMLPGVDLTKQQMIYLAHAQTFCALEDEWYYFYTMGVPVDIKVNMALGQLQEFSDAFQCKSGSAMNHSTKCGYY